MPKNVSFIFLVMVIALLFTFSVPRGMTSEVAPNDILSSSDPILVSEEAYDSKDPSEILRSNFDVVEELREKGLPDAGISRRALASYYVDYYLAEVNNGGFAQFVWNSRWSSEVTDLVTEGLREMKAPRNLALFQQGADAVRGLGTDGLADYLGRQTYGQNPVRDHLNAINDRFFATQKDEDLDKLNADWVREQPDNRVLSDKDLQYEIQRRVAVVGNLAERSEVKKNAEPRFFRLIRELCEKTGITLQRVTAGDPALFYDGTILRNFSPDEASKPSLLKERKIVWFFIADNRPFAMAEFEGKAAMFDGKTRQKLLEISEPD